ncbi:hypothetical protein BDR26DRAFT_1002646 [Obelidium mucronatum]|nr:hypothetical protein BDR26DRAFT_1002646 [Obelidium mucronatum]
MTSPVFFAVGFTWTVEFAYGTPLLASLAIPAPLIALVWLAGPLSGLVVQPVAGAVSDACNSRFGRRRPFLAAYSALLVCAVLCVACATLCRDLFAAQVTAVLGFCILDVAINGLTACSRALVVDVAPDSQHLASRAIAFGTVAGYFIGFIDLSLIGLPLTQLQSLCFVCILVITASVSYTCLHVTETPRKKQSRSSEESIERSLLFLAPIYAIWNQFKILPTPIYSICMVQFWAWIGWFPFLFYASSWVASKHPLLKNKFPSNNNNNLNEDDQNKSIVEEAVRTGTYALLGNSIASLLTMSIVPRILTAAVASSSTAESPQNALLLLWSCSLLSFVFLLSSTLFVDSMEVACLVVACVGVPWAVTSWVPFTLISSEIKRDCGGAVAFVSLDEDENRPIIDGSDHDLDNRQQGQPEEFGTSTGSSSSSRSSSSSSSSTSSIMELLSTFLTSFVFYVYGPTTNLSIGTNRSAGSNLVNSTTESLVANDAFGACLRVGIVPCRNCSLLGDDFDDQKSDFGLIKSFIL